MNLLSDVLDQQLIDCTGGKTGKVDGIVLEIRSGAPPRVAWLEAGSGILARRLSSRLERLVMRLRRRMSGRESEPFQVPWSKVMHVGVSVNLTIDGPADPFENWLRVHIIERIPFNAHGTHRERHE